jgi:DNA-directed RNA polymerase specialized sigma24 family protein
MHKKFYNEQYRREIMGYANNYKISGQTSEDIAQEMDIALWEGLPKFEGRNGASQRGFAVTIMGNRLKNIFKASQAQKRILDRVALTFSELEALTDDYEYALATAKSIYEI